MNTFRCALSVSCFVALVGGACGDQDLQTGSYSLTTKGTQDTFGGQTAEFSSTVDIDVNLTNGTGQNTYEFFVCGGLVDYQSTTPCFGNIEVQNGSDGLTGFLEVGWNVILSTGQNSGSDTVDPTLIEGCSGTESIAITGEVEKDTSATIQLTYHLLIDQNSTDACDTYVSSLPYRIQASGTMELKGGE